MASSTGKAADAIKELVRLTKQLQKAGNITKRIQNITDQVSKIAEATGEVAAATGNKILEGLKTAGDSVIKAAGSQAQTAQVGLSIAKTDLKAAALAKAGEWGTAIKARLNRNKVASMAHYAYGTPMTKAKPPGLFKRARTVAGNEKHSEQLNGAIGAGVGALTAVLTQSLTAAKTFSTAAGTLRASVSATPESMKELLESFRAVSTQVPQDMNDIAAAMGTLSKETKLTGQPLQALSVTLLNASRLTGMSGAEAAASAAKAMTAWGITGDQGVSTLEKFYAASKAGGVGMGDLMKKTAALADPMRALGLDLGGSLALLSKWEKAGLTPLDDLSKLKQALPAGGLASIAAKMQKAKTEAKAAAIASKYFGDAVGADLANALKGGGTGFKDITDAMGNSGNLIANQSQALMNFGDQWGILQNRITTALAPVGEMLLPVATMLVSMLEAVAAHADIVGAGIIGVAAALLYTLFPALIAVAAPFAPIILAALAVGAAFAGLYYIFTKIAEVWPKIMAFISEGLEGLGISGLFGSKSDSGTAVAASAPGAKQLPAAYHGLDYVPYDGMVARLHKGERVMTASENRAFGQSGAASISITGNTFNVRQDSDIDAIARALAREIKAAGGLMA